jgi:transposase-like protein
MEAQTGGISTRKVDALVEALGGDSGITKSEASRICQGLDEQMKAYWAALWFMPISPSTTSMRRTSTAG